MKKTLNQRKYDKSMQCPVCKSRMTHDPDNNRVCEQCMHIEY